MGQSNSVCASEDWVNSEYHRGIYDHDLDDDGHDDDDDEGDKDDVASLQDFQEGGIRQTARQPASHPGAI